MLEWLKNLFSKLFMKKPTPAEPIKIDPLPPVNPTDISPWFTIAKRYIGQKELTGKNDGQFVADCFKAVKSSLKADKWCAAFVGRCLAESGYPFVLRGVAAMHYAQYGLKCDLKPGAIIVLRHPNGSHHVTFLDHVVNDHLIACTGGNQANAVRTTLYDTTVDKIVACRWPAKGLE